MRDLLAKTADNSRPAPRPTDQQPLTTMLQAIFIGGFTGTQRRVNPSISSILAAMPSRVHHAIEAREILRIVACEFAIAVARRAAIRRGFTYTDGVELGVLVTHRMLLRLFLRDLPRAEQLAIGAAMRRTLAGLHQSSNPVIHQSPL